ncbi:MAG: serine/threonine-protein kinase [Phycisphaerales bacterium]|nr:serine/threonine-protein kinase [Phycisphaerales bacterium]
MDNKDNEILGVSGTPNPELVKELFGLYLDAADAVENDEPNAEEIKDSVEQALSVADGVVRKAVKDLLNAHSRAADTGLFCEHKSESNSSGLGSQEFEVVLVPPVIEGFAVGDEIGRGGFGVVYRGEQLVPVKRPVAIKLLRTDLATSAMVSRFISEASLLARMNHQGIARVIDAGLDRENRPFVAMELIDGEPINSYCENHKLATRQRVRIIEQVCHAVHHAHQRAVIHRDLKPANILVELQDGTAQPKVIDFGIAKLVEESETDSHTLAGHRLGTPRYMSPEQRDGKNEVDTRIDVYALGVLLCEVLTGHVPYKETKDNSRLSTRPSMITERTQSSELKGDLDRIVLKATANDPEMRYQSAAAMSDDLNRYLTGLPVLATDPGVVYRGIKFLQRHKIASVLAGVAMLGLVVGTTGLTVGFNRATASRDIAQAALVESERQRQRAEFVNRFLLEDMLSVIDPNVNQGRDISVREVFDNASVNLSSRSDVDIETQYTTLRLIGLVYSEIGAHDEAMSSFRRAASLAEKFHGAPCREAIEIRLHLYDVIVSNGRSGMTKVGDQLNTDAQAVLSPNEDLYQRVRLRTTNSIEELLVIIEKIKSDPHGDKREQLRAVSSIANLFAFAFERDKEIEYRRQAYELSNQIYGEDHSSTFGRLGHYAALRMGNQSDMETLDMLYRAYEPARRMLGAEHPVTLSSMRTYANLLGILSDPNEAVALLEECEQGYRARFGASSTSHTVTCSVLGEHYLRAGRAQEALELQLQVRDDRARQWSEGHMYHAVDQINLAQCYIALGQSESARIAANIAIELAREGSLQQTRAFVLHSKALVRLGMNQDALVQIDQAKNQFITLSSSLLGYYEIGDDLVEVLEEIGDSKQAELLRESLIEAQKNG